MSEWFCKDCNKDELVDLPNEMHEYLTNCFGNNGRYDSLSAIKIYDFLIEQGLGEVDFLSSEELLSVGFTGPLVDHFCNRADLKKQLGMLDEAIDDCNKAITLDMEWSNAYNTRGTIYDRKGDEFQELKDYEKAVEIDNNGAALTNLGNYYKRKGQFDIAIRYYDQAILLDQDSEVKCWAHTGRGDIFCTQGNYEKAMVEYEIAESLDQDYAWLHYKRGDCHSSKAIFLEYSEKNGVDYTRVIIEYTQAIEDFSRANELDPGCAWYAKDLSYAYLSRAEIYKKENQFDLVIQDVSRYMELDRENDDLSNYYNCGGLLVDCEAYDKAVIAFNKFLEKYPDPLGVGDRCLTEALNWRGIAHCELGDYEQALADHNLAIKIAPDKPFGYCNLGDDYYAMGQYEKAIEYYTLSLKFDFEVSQSGSYTLYRRYKAYKAIGEDEKAQADLESNVW